MSILSPRPLGIRPQYEYAPLETGFWNAAVPSLCVVPLQQHAGSRIEPLVGVGDSVREGMVIAESDRRLGLPLHAPIPGRVGALGATRLFDGTVSPAISIELYGEFDRLGKQTDPIEWDTLSREELLERIRNAGVVCGPRSAVPAYRYLGATRTTVPPTIVLDLAESEPYMTGGIERAVADGAAVSTGLQIAAAALGTKDIHAMIGRGHARRLTDLRGAARAAGIQIHTVPRRYPGIVPATLQRVLKRPHGRVDEEILVVSPQTAFAIYEAVVFEKPQVDQVIAVGGSAVKRPAHVRVRIGTSIADVLAECGGLIDTPDRIIAGGPLTGRLVQNVNAPITKTTAAVVALRADEVRENVQEPCIGCGACSRACPARLDPQLLFRHLEAARIDDAVAAGLPECVECGLCSHVCPSRIPLAMTFRDTKSKHLGGGGDEEKGGVR